MELILPDQYRGPFKVVVSPRVEPGYQRKADRFVLVVPEDGRLSIGDAWPMKRLRTITAAYAGGEPIAAGAAPPESDDALRLVRLGQSRNEHWWVVGNAGETAFIQKVWSDGALPTLNVMLGPAWPSRPGELKPIADAQVPAKP